MRRPSKHSSRRTRPGHETELLTPAETPVAPTSRAGRRTQTRRRAGGKPRAGRMKRVLAAIALFVLAIACIGTAYAYWSYRSFTQAIKPDKQEAAEIAQVLAPVDKDADNRFEYLLLLGDDRRPGEQRARTDTIILTRIDRETGGIVMLSIPRDSRVNVAGHGMSKINAAGNWGGTPLAISTVTSFTGVPIDHYARIDFDGLDMLVDQVGGVQMVVEDSFYVVGPNDVIVERIRPGVHLLNGQQAISFVRNRKYRDGDFSRIDNQQKFLLVLAQKLSQERNLAKAPQMVKSLGKHFQTDMTAGYLIDLARATRGSKAGIKTYTVPGTMKRIDGQSFVIPDEVRMHKFLDQLLKGETPAAI